MLIKKVILYYECLGEIEIWVSYLSSTRHTVFQRAEKGEATASSFYEGNITLTIQDKKMLEMEININIAIALISKPLVNLIKEYIF